MSEIVLRIEDVSKMYRLGLVSTKSLSNDLVRWWHVTRGKEDPFLKVGEVNDRTQKGNSDFVWALKDVSFDVHAGETIGLIGRNGAGKSTLLKLLSRVTKPTTGSIKVKGRIASLLEVGTGFHPELSGRENIFLNGAILGMRKVEIQQKLDQIIDFSGVERYIDTPVKRYSSGMYVRLAFAVAAHLESEILIIDEVLAVGDAEFQRKCLGRMEEASNQEGRTVLFVSHNMAAVKSICNRGILMENGGMVLDGSVDQAIARYLGGKSEVEYDIHRTWQLDSDRFVVSRMWCSNFKDEVSTVLKETLPIYFSLRYCTSEASNYSHVAFHLKNEVGESLFSFTHEGVPLENGENTLSFVIPAYFLQSGQFYLSMLLVDSKKKCIYHERDVLSFVVSDGGRELGEYMGREPGYVRPKFETISYRS
jgi:lipopolysaccharide transport system ATP-binding protein